MAADMRTEAHLAADAAVLAQGLSPAGLVRTIRGLHDRLAAAPRLQPGDAIDAVFRRLVQLVVATPQRDAAAVLSDPAIQALRPRLVELCAHGEYELELAWARFVATSRVPGLAIARFPYLRNYQQLSQLELEALGRHTPRPPRRTLFVGSGPLPLSSLFLARHLGTPVDNLDHDATAVRLARAITPRLSQCRFVFHHHDIVGFPDIARYDLVVLAALVGLTPDHKRLVLHHLHQTMAPGAILLARSAHGLRTLLYPAIRRTDLDPYELLHVHHPRGTVINSIVLARKAGGA